MSGNPQGAFVVISKISLGDISCIISKKVTTAVTFSVTQGLAHGCDNLKKTTKRSRIKYMNFTFRDFDPSSYMEKWHDMLDHSGGMCIKESVTSYDRVRMR